MDPGHVYWTAHVDKANIATYDYSALLYLNTQDVDFTGARRLSMCVCVCVRVLIMIWWR
eukprot:COSAG01_NODE_12388_length_1749_cov_1.274545_2_plen_59_part_00